MMSKISLLAAGFAGYVLGARAGRERYEQIAFQAQRFWTNPSVQRASQQAQDYAREKAPAVGERIGDVAKTAAAKAGEKVSSGSDGTSGSSGTPS
jgi:hypothetical protein